MSCSAAGDWINASKHRSISILPALSRIGEKTVHTQLYLFLVTNKLPSRETVGFRRRLSTSSVLTSFADGVLNREQGRPCGAMFLDLTKAFDTVGNQTLLSKPSEYGLSANSPQWFCSYINDRKQRTSCGNEMSNELPVTHGVL